ncbi:MAG TPA: hypothetical protein VGO47_10190 [Chlamydiales bacterium]|jgi:hypothetical protein|nr:hypothetical protein [Chlamydiales bacterium]
MLVIGTHYTLIPSHCDVDRPSTFSGAPGPGYIMGKALYWTGNRIIAAIEMFNINNRVKNHMIILRSRRNPSSNNSLQNDMLFQILDDALELSKWVSLPFFLVETDVMLLSVGHVIPTL